MKTIDDLIKFYKQAIPEVEAITNEVVPPTLDLSVLEDLWEKAHSKREFTFYSSREGVEQFEDAMKASYIEDLKKYQREYDMTMSHLDTKIKTELATVRAAGRSAGRLSGKSDAITAMNIAMYADAQEKQKTDK